MKTTVYLDSDVLRWTRIAAARRGVKDSDIVEEALRQHLAGAVFQEVWEQIEVAGTGLEDDEAIALASEELRAVQREQRGKRRATG